MPLVPFLSARPCSCCPCTQWLVSRTVYESESERRSLEARGWLPAFVHGSGHDLQLDAKRRSVAAGGTDDCVPNSFALGRVGASVPVKCQPSCRFTVCACLSSHVCPCAPSLCPACSAARPATHSASFTQRVTDSERADTQKQMYYQCYHYLSQLNVLNETLTAKANYPKAGGWRGRRGYVPVSQRPNTCPVVCQHWRT